MRFFGSYLVERGWINQDALIEALVFQTEAAPSVARVVQRLKLLTSDQIIEVFQYQVINQTEFLQACRDLGYWNEALRKAVLTEFKSVVKPLGHVLLDQKKISLAHLTEALAQYVQEAPDPHERKVASASVRLQKIAPSVFKLHEVYGQMLDEDLRQQLMKLIADPSQRPQLLVHLRTMAFAAAYAELSWSVILLEKATMALVEQKASDHDLRTTIDGLWKLKTMILNDRSESQLSPEDQAVLTRLFKAGHS